MSRYPSEFLSLIAFLKKLPGVGSKTAERFAFTLLDWPAKDVRAFSNALSTLRENIYPCAVCSCLKNSGPCVFCDLSKRDPTLLCVVSSPKDVYAIEETRAFKGMYQVIGGLLSPLEGKSIRAEAMERLMKRLDSHPIQEVIIALDSTLEGDATALFLKKKFDERGVSATRLAFGLPMDSPLDFVDYGTLEKALTGRRTF